MYGTAIYLTWDMLLVDQLVKIKKIIPSLSVCTDYQPGRFHIS